MVIANCFAIFHSPGKPRSPFSPSRPGIPSKPPNPTGPGFPLGPAGPIKPGGPIEKKTQNHKSKKKIHSDLTIIILLYLSMTLP